MPDLASPDGTHLTFALKKTVTLCPPHMDGVNGTCYDEEFLPGEYDVHVTNPNSGQSNSVRFTILP